MNKKLKSILLLLCFAVLLIGAYLLYNNLKDEYANDQLMQDSTPQSDTPQTEEELDRPKETVTEDVAESDEKEEETEKQTAPDFTVTDTEGNDVRLREKFGKPIVLNFWASWCPPCKAEMPDFNNVYAEYGDSVEFMMVNMTDGRRETVEIAKSFIEEKGFSFPVYFDTESSAAIAYSVYSLPATYFIDENGVLIAHAVGMINEETLLRGINMITADSEPSADGE